MFYFKFKVLLFPLIFILSACGGGGSGGSDLSINETPNLSNPINSIAWRNPISPTNGIIVSETNATVVIVEDSINSADLNTSDDSRWIANQYSEAVKSPPVLLNKWSQTYSYGRFGVIASKPNNIPNGTMKYDGYSRVKADLPTSVRSAIWPNEGSIYSGSSERTLEGPLELSINMDTGSGQLDASFSTKISSVSPNASDTVTSTLDIAINQVDSTGRITGTGSFHSSAGSDYSSNSVFVGNLSGPNAEEFVGIVGGENHVGQVIGTR